jgi:hypothetical protein
VDDAIARGGTGRAHRHRSLADVQIPRQRSTVAPIGVGEIQMFAQSIAATVVSWFGIVGGVLTIFGHLQSAVGLSDWERWISVHWQSWMMAFWTYLGLSRLTTNTGYILVDFPLILCLLLIAVASRFAQGSDAEVSTGRKLLSLIAGSGLLAGWYATGSYLAGRGIEIGIPLYFIVDWFVVFLMVSQWPYKLALLAASATTILLVLLIIANNGLVEATNMDLAVEVMLMTALGAAVVFVARPSVFTRQICFLLLILGALVALSELSKFGVTLEPPKA